MGTAIRTVTITITLMATTTDLLTLTQWLSPAFPLGSFAYSHGLEAAITRGDVTDADSLQGWLSYLLEHGTGFTDATLLCLALNGEDMADTARALASSAERLEEAEAQGLAFADTVTRISCENARPAPLPVAVGEAARRLSLEAEEVAALYLHAFASNLVSAAVRFVPLGQGEGQAALAALHPVITGVAARAATASLDDLGSAAFGADLSAMEHETLEVRIFKT